MSNQLKQNTTAGEYVTVLHIHDVLFGRGSGPNDHKGNIRFRELVHQRKAEYMATNHRQTKAKIAKNIVDQVFSVGGRFLKKLEPDEVSKLSETYSIDPSCQDVYQVVGDDTIMEKAKQALRQNRNREESLSPKPSPRQTVSLQDNTNTATMASAMIAGSSGDRGSSAFHPPLTNLHTTIDQQQHDALLFQQELLRQQQRQQQQQQHAMMYGIGGENSVMLPTNVGIPSNRVASDGGNDGRISSSLGSGNGSNHDTLYSHDADGYATYTTTLENPDDHCFFRGHPTNHANTTTTCTIPSKQSNAPFNQRSFMDIAGATGNSCTRRSSLLGGRKPDLLPSDMTVLDPSSYPQPFNNDSVNPNPGRRDSLQFDEIWRRASLNHNRDAVQASMQMSEFMESFRGMSTTGGDDDFHHSDDTIGTIDGLVPGGMSMAYWSEISQMSMNMSTDSIFKFPTSGRSESKSSSMSSSNTTGSNHSSSQRRGRKSLVVAANNATSDGTFEGGVQTTAGTSMPVDSIKNDDSAVSTDNMESSDLWNSRQIQTLMQGPMESSSFNFDNSHNLSSSTFLKTLNNNNSGRGARTATRLSITSESMANHDQSIPHHVDLFEDLPTPTSWDDQPPQQNQTQPQHNQHHRVTPAADSQSKPAQYIDDC